MQKKRIPVIEGAPFLARFVREKRGFSRTAPHMLPHPSPFPKGGKTGCIQLELILCVLLLFLTSCSPREFLTRRLASDLISASPEFQNLQRFTLQTGIVSNKDYASPEYLVLQHHGWISGTSSACTPGLAPPPCWDVLFTPSGVDTIRTVVSGEESTKPSMTIPAARRELVGVTGIAKQGSAADVEFTWKWIPLNEIGAALYSGDLHFKSVVGFRQYDEGWRVAEGTPRSGQSIDDALKNAEPAP